MRTSELVNSLIIFRVRPAPSAWSDVCDLLSTGGGELFNRCFRRSDDGRFAGISTRPETRQEMPCRFFVKGVLLDLVGNRGCGPDRWSVFQSGRRR